MSVSHTFPQLLSAHVLTLLIPHLTLKYFSHESLFKYSILRDVALAYGLLCEFWSSILRDMS
jgi:hypothetical protein